MDIYSAIKDDQEALWPMLKKLATAGKHGRDACTQIVSDIQKQLIPHMRAEESVFYNSLRDLRTGRFLVVNRYREHADIEAMLHALAAYDTLPSEWEEDAILFTETLERHFNEEQGPLFTEARKLLLDHEAIMMTDAYVRIKEEIINTGSTPADMPALIADMMPERFRVPTQHV